MGVLGVPTNVLIDIDECGVFLTTSNRKYGKGYVGCRVRSVGPYGHDVKWTLIMAIMSNGFRHVRFRKVGGATAVDFLLFVQQIIVWLSPLSSTSSSSSSLSDSLERSITVMKVFLNKQEQTDTVRSMYLALQNRDEFLMTTIVNEIECDVPINEANILVMYEISQLHP